MASGSVPFRSVQVEHQWAEFWAGKAAQFMQLGSKEEDDWMFMSHLKDVP